MSECRVVGGTGDRKVELVTVQYLMHRCKFDQRWASFDV